MIQSYRVSNEEGWDLAVLHQLSEAERYHEKMILFAKKLSATQDRRYAEKMKEADMFFMFDLSSGFWQIPLYPPHKLKTAFVTHYGFYQYCVMPFGLTNAPATFQRAVELIRDGYRVFIVDLVAASHGAEEHQQKIRILFQVIRAKANHIKLGLQKCVFFRTRIHFLGHVISEDGISVDMKKIQAVNDFPVPKSVKNIQQLLGLARYYRRFVKGFS